MQLDGQQPQASTYALAMAACCSNKQGWQTALELMQTMRSKGLQPDVAAYNAALQACATGSQYATAAALFEEMQKAGVTPTETTWKTYLYACGGGSQPGAGSFDQVE